MSEEKTAIVAGASHGIGAGLVGAFLKQGYIVVGALALTLPLHGQQSAIGDSRRTNVKIVRKGESHGRRSSTGCRMA